MIFIILITLAGSILASIYDLKTTDVPDEIPALMISFALFFYYIYSLINNNIFYLFLSLVVGTLLLAFGLFLYKTGQWGGADALLLGAIGSLLPYHPSVPLFPLRFFMNLFIVGAIYIALYTIIIGIRSKKVRKEFLKSINWYYVVLPAIIFIIGAIFFTPTLLTTALLALLCGLPVYYKYAKTIETQYYTRTIHSRELKPGDVIYESKKWKGLTEQEVSELKKEKKQVTIKEGIRFIPAFPIALIITLLFGGLIF